MLAVSHGCILCISHGQSRYSDHRSQDKYFCFEKNPNRYFKTEPGWKFNSDMSI
jgi:hypothetical protein